ncbi:MAG: hypothetical protein AAF974_12455 [Cyanobacteria bacterium P01_E01_bin.34]
MPTPNSIVRHLSRWPARFISLCVAAIAIAWMGMFLIGAQAATSPNSIAPTPAITQTSTQISETVAFTDSNTIVAQVEVPDPQQFRSLEQEDSSLSILRAEELLQQAQSATQAQDFDTAVSLLEEAFNAFNQRSNFYQALSRSFAGIDNRLSDTLREQAREAAQSRDQTSFELGVVYRAANRPEEAVSQMVQVISSQGPTRELGANAYSQLLELGFVDTPFES